MLRQTTRKAILGLFALAALSAAGCGGNTSKEPNFYTGKWSGSWQSVTLDDGGGLSITVGTDGTLTGSMGLDKLSESGDVVGTVAKDGQFHATVTFPDTSVFGLNGQITKTNDSLQGNYNTKTNGKSYSSEFTVTPGSGN